MWRLIGSQISSRVTVHGKAQSHLWPQKWWSIECAGLCRRLQNQPHQRATFNFLLHNKIHLYTGGSLVHVMALNTLFGKEEDELVAENPHIPSSAFLKLIRRKHRRTILDDLVPIAPLAPHPRPTCCLPS